MDKGQSGEVKRMTIPQHWLKGSKRNVPKRCINLRVSEEIWVRMHQTKYQDLYWSAILRDALIAAMDLVDDNPEKGNE